MTTGSSGALCQDRQPIAQSEERRTRIAEVVGSNPIRSTMQVVNRFLAASAADHRT